MGRKERPLDPDAGPVERFAVDLRELRRKAGPLTYRDMAGRVPYSVATLSRAASGEQLPSLAVTRAYVEACGGDVEEWTARWHRLAEETFVRAAPGDTDRPYQGLARYEPGDREKFFGRERLTEELLRLTGGHRLVAVLGPSGSGKSSLLRAGLIPRLQSPPADGPCPAAIRTFTPGARPFGTHRQLFAAAAGPGDTWLVIDQFEEVFTLCRDPAERARFLDLLLDAQDPARRLCVVLGLRADFYGHCLQHRTLAEALRHTTVPVTPMSPAELREAIVKPAAAHGLIVERALTDRLIEETADQPGGLPLLSHALLETWRHRRGRTLALEVYEAVGGVQGAIARTAETLYTQLSPEQARLARWALLRLVTPGEGAHDTRRPADRAELDAATSPGITVVLERLARARLITLDEDTVDLAHEALITAWPRLRSWVDADRDRLRLHRRLTEAARTWERLGRDAGALYRGTQLTAAQEAFADPADLTASERDFLAAGAAARRREARRRKGVVGAVAVLVTLTLVAGVLAWQQSRAGRARQEQAAARRVAAVAESLRASEPAKARQLSVAAWRIAETAETRSALTGAWTQPLADSLDVADRDALAFLSADGRTVVTAAPGHLTVWDVRTRRKVRTTPGPGTRAMTAVAMSPDARLVVFQLTGRRLALWDVAARRWTGRTLDASDQWGVQFSPGGARLLIQTARTIQVWDTRDQHLLVERPAFPRRGREWENVAAISPDDRLLAVCSPGGTVELWDVPHKKPLPAPWSRARAGESCTPLNGRFSPDSRTFALVTRDGLRRWELATGRELPRVAQSPLGTVTFSRDGRFLIGRSPGEVLVWRTSQVDHPVFRGAMSADGPADIVLDGGTLRYLAANQVRSLDLTAAATSRWAPAAAQSAAFSPDARHLGLVWTRGPTARFETRDTRSGAVVDSPTDMRLPPQTPRRKGQLRIEPDEVLSFSADGTRVAYGVTGDYAGNWDLSPGLVAVRDVPGHRTLAAFAGGQDNSPTEGAVLSPDGSRLITSSVRSVQVWDIGSRRREKSLSVSGGSPMTLRPDGRLLVTRGEIVKLPAGTPMPRRLTRQDTAYAFSPTGNSFAVGEETGNVTVWDGDIRRRFGQLPAFTGGRQQQWHEAVSALAFSPDGRTLAVAGAYGSLQLWDVPSQQPLGSALPTPGDKILALTFNRDGTALYAAGQHVTLTTHRIAPDALVADVCHRAGGSLSRADWETYIPEVPYRKVC
ncbi:hypothetical protein CP973_25675 [Streptomyces albofaciens JCM 4342]|uniref:nSTAND1 domain-containing NTPase n=1 Tax=Streptomyces albofaciens TaxID=66866 RepID=UPI00123B7C57|nr:hypothetical protein [Streptomyces albofaciens]KAA6212741.1 hypothetical protein CP973_25675 [Streptomyces albofaciens JCM 4342]